MHLVADPITVSEYLMRVKNPTHKKINSAQFQNTQQMMNILQIFFITICYFMTSLPLKRRLVNDQNAIL